VVLVERTSDPVAAPEVAVTVMVYAPAGVPRLPMLEPPPPQATRDAAPRQRTELSRMVLILLSFEICFEICLEIGFELCF
jgi:hypothetical protein